MYIKYTLTALLASHFSSAATLQSLRNSVIDSHLSPTPALAKKAIGTSPITSSAHHGSSSHGFIGQDRSNALESSGVNSPQGTAEVHNSNVKLYHLHSSQGTSHRHGTGHTGHRHQHLGKAHDHHNQGTKQKHSASSPESSGYSQPHPNPSATPPAQSKPGNPSSPTNVQKFEGDITYYTPGLGSCGVTNSESDMIVALAEDMMAPEDGSNPNDNPWCGRSITISHGGVTAVATIEDTCPGCSGAGLDLTPALFQKFADLSVGRVSRVQWWFN